MQAAMNSTPVPTVDSTANTAASNASQGARANNQSGEKFAAVLRSSASKSMDSNENTAPAEPSAEPAPAAQETSSPGPGSKGASSSAPSSDTAKVDDKPDKPTAATAADQSASGNAVPSWLPEWLVTTGVVNANATQPQPAPCPTSDDATANAITPQVAAPAVAANPMLTSMIGDANSKSLPAAQTGKVEDAPTTNAAEGSTPLALTDKSSAQDALQPALPQLVKHEALPSGNDNAQTAAATTVTADRPLDTQAALAPRNDLSMINNAVSTASTLIAQHAAPSPINTTSTPVTTTLSMPMSDPRWQDAFATQVTWQVRDGLQHVNLALNPAELGPVEVRLSVNDGQVSAQFHTAHQNVRQVIEDAMPKLRDMLSQSGLNLANANVFQQSPGRDQRSGQIDTPWSSSSGTAVDETEAVSSARSVSVTHQGLIDAYV